MACEQCLEAWTAENIQPPCFVGIDDCKGEEDEPGVNCCWIPDVTDVERRILILHSRLANLSDLNIGSDILRMYDATTEDIDLLAIIKDELIKIAEVKSRDGLRSEHQE